MAAGDLLRVTVRMNVANQPVTITLGFAHLSSTGDIEQDLCSMIAKAVSVEFTTLQTKFSRDWTCEGAVARKVTGLPAAPGRAHTNLVRGNIDVQAIPATKSLMVNHKQRLQDVRCNGSSFVTGLVESEVDGNRVTAQATIDAIVTVFDNLMDITETIPAGSATYQMVVLAKPANGGAGVVGLPVVSNTCRDILYNSARRRTREYGYAIDTELPPN